MVRILMEAPSGQTHCSHFRLCAETPRTEGRVVDESDVKLLQLAHELQSASFTTDTPAMHLRQDGFDSRNQCLSCSSSQNMTYLLGQGRTSCKRISLTGSWIRRAERRPRFHLINA